MTEPFDGDNNETVYYEISPELEAAQIAKLAAEAEEHRANAALALKDKELREAEIREALARAENEEHRAAMQAISRAERQRTEDLALLQDYLMHHLYFNGEVDERSVFNTLNTLAVWDRRDPTCPMNITLNSPGGSVVDGMHLFDQIVGYSIRGGGQHKVTITVRGEAASMAGILLQAADERVIGPNAQLLIHQISSWTGGSLGNIKDDVKRLDMLSDQVVDIFLERSNGKIDRETFERSWERRDWWLSAQQALDYGFVDRIG